MLPEDCPLCNDIGGQLIYQNNLFRLVLVADATYSGYVRLILQRHVREFSDLSLAEANLITQALFKAEKIVRQVLAPDKMNLASLGNQVAHLHWHIIPRFQHDTHFPNSIWGEVTHSKYIADFSRQELLLNTLATEFINL